MNPLLKKEIRLLLPGWCAVMLLEALQPWVWGRESDIAFAVCPVAFFFGMVILAVDSFGREFSLGTFQSLMSQPIERRQIWRTKIAVLFSASIMVLAVYLASCSLRFYTEYNLPSARMIFDQSMIASIAVLFITLTGGLWTAILLRQTAAAFWISFLAPMAIMMGIILIMSECFASSSDTVLEILLYIAAILYSGFGFWLAHQLFHRAQDVAWTGGDISFSKWRYFETGAKTVVSTRSWQPVKTLLRKELQMQSISFFCAFVLLAMHIGVILMRVFYANFHKNSIADGVSEFYWSLWLIMPIVIGGTAVAEERKLGVTEQSFCLPVSRVRQFVIKFIPTLILSMLLGGVMPLLVETLVASHSSPLEIFTSGYHYVNDPGSDLLWFELSIIGLATGFYLAAFFASTLAKNFLQALSIAIVILVGCCFVVPFVKYLDDEGFSFFGIMPWPPVLFILLGIPTFIILFLWLTFGNFSYYRETRRLWWRNIGGIIGTFLCVFAISALIYNRVWEVFVPVEPAHGVAKLSIANPPKLHSEFDNILVQLPDGRVWFDEFDGDMIPHTPREALKRALFRTRPNSLGPRQFMTGSNWVSAASRGVRWLHDQSTSEYVVGYLDTVGVKADGTLWISAKSTPGHWTGNDMQQFGQETNWQQAAFAYGNAFGSVLLLKNDGTLWRWGTNHIDWAGWQTNWPTVRNSAPRQIGTNSDWKELFGNWGVSVLKNDGTSWFVGIDPKTKYDQIVRMTNYDHIPVQKLSIDNDNTLAFVRDDGTLWLYNRQGAGFLQVGQETNWAEVAVMQDNLVALKKDGSLWKWEDLYFTANTAKSVPTRLGIHDDWVGVVKSDSGAIAMAADGSLWFWPRTHYFDGALLKAPKQPKLLGNVFNKAD